MTREPLCHLLENNLHAVVHRRDPCEELDYWVHAITCIGQTSGTKVEQSDGEVADQNCDVLITCHSACGEPEKRSAQSDTDKGGHVSEHITSRAVIEVKAIEGEECDEHRVDPRHSQNLTDDGKEVGMDGVHVIGVFALKNRVVLGDLQDLAEAHVDEVI